MLPSSQVCSKVDSTYRGPSQNKPGCNQINTPREFSSRKLQLCGKFHRMQVHDERFKGNMGARQHRRAVDLSFVSFFYAPKLYIESELRQPVGK